MEQTKEPAAIVTRRRSWVGYVTMGAVSILAAAAVVIAVAVTNEAEAQTPASDLKRFILIGLCEPVDDSPKTLAGFDEWFVNQHVEDVSHTPGFVRSRVYKLRGPHLKGATYTQYISFYEVDAPSWEQAEKVLNEWQRNPNAWPGRANHMATGKRVGNVMKCPGSGWYEMLNTHNGPAKAATKLD